MPEQTRRRFLARGAGLACAPLAASLPAFAAGSDDDLTASRFAAQVNRTFTAQPLAATGAPALTLRLRSVGSLAHAAPGLAPEAARERSFILVFDVEGSVAAQDTYVVANPVIGTFAALLVPGRDGRVLTAVFNRTA